MKPVTPIGNLGQYDSALAIGKPKVWCVHGRDDGTHPRMDVAKQKPCSGALEPSRLRSAGFGSNLFPSNSENTL
jgi:hypothetical protein